MEQQRDEKLWRIAQQRASFRKSLYSFIIVILFLWAIWWFTSGTAYLDNRTGVPWPCWVMLGWGFGLALQYYKAYHGNKEDLTEEEYKKLKQQQNL